MGALAEKGDQPYELTPKTRKEIIALGEAIQDRNWRVNNLYSIIDENGKAVRFKPYATQQGLLDNVFRKNIILKGRQLRVTTAYCINWLDGAMFSKNTKIGIVAHTKHDAAKIFREKIAYPYDTLPPALQSPLKSRTQSEFKFENGSEISIGVSYRSGTLQVLHVTEYGYTCARQPLRADEVRTGGFIAAQDGIIVVESTAMGRAGTFAELCAGAQKGNQWHFKFLPWYDEPRYVYAGDEAIAERREGETDYLDELQAKVHRKFTQAQRHWWIANYRDYGEKMFQEFPSTAEEAFKLSTEGAYYGKQMLDAWRTGRVTTIPINPGIQVETWWDIGMGDSTAIWFVQRQGFQILVVDYYENSGEGFPHYAKYCRDWAKEHGVSFSRHIGPHDLKNRQWMSETAETRIRAAAALGFVFELAAEMSIADGIDAVRRQLPMCAFDESRCGKGIQMLESYRKKWNAALACWHDYPLHDFASHGADAFRMGVIGLGAAPIILGSTRKPAPTIAAVRWR